MKKVQAEEEAKAAKKRRRRKGKGADDAPDLEPALRIKTLEEEPKLSPHLFWVWQAFTDLNYRRSAGMGGPQPISYTDIDAYCRLKAIYSPGERQRLLLLIDPLDRAWMAKAHEEQEKKTNKGNIPPPSHSPPRGGGRRSPPTTEV